MSSLEKGLRWSTVTCKTETFLWCSRNSFWQWWKRLGHYVRDCRLISRLGLPKGRIFSGGLKSSTFTSVCRSFRQGSVRVLSIWSIRVAEDIKQKQFCSKQGNGPPKKAACNVTSSNCTCGNRWCEGGAICCWRDDGLRVELSSADK